MSGCEDLILSTLENAGELGWVRGYLVSKCLWNGYDQSEIESKIDELLGYGHLVVVPSEDSLQVLRVDYKPRAKFTTKCEILVRDPNGIAWDDPHKIHQVTAYCAGGMDGDVAWTRDPQHSHLIVELVNTGAEWVTSRLFSYTWVEDMSLALKELAEDLERSDEEE